MIYPVTIYFLSCRPDTACLFNNKIAIKMKTILIMLLILCLPVFSFSQKGDTITKNKNICDDLNKNEDIYSGEMTIQFRIEDNSGGSLTFTRNIKKEENVLNLSIWIKVQDTTKGTGVNVILKNGKTISKPGKKIEYSKVGNNTYAGANFQLTTDDIELLKESGIEKYSLYTLRKYIRQIRLL
jgi:hypothetical protein